MKFESKFAKMVSLTIPLFSISCPVFGDDTDIFFHGTDAVRAKPNILFILDNSSSMRQEPGGLSSGPTKTEILKKVMKGLLAEIDGVNVGLQAFSVPGGPIQYPVSSLDASASPYIVSRITHENDDGIEKSDRRIDLDNGNVEIRTGETIALRFSEVNVPQGARVTNAALSIFSDVDVTKTGGVLRIYAEDSDDSSPLPTSIGAITSRPVTAAYVDWTLPTWSSEHKNEIFSSVDISSLINEVVSRDGWCGGNAIMLKMQLISAGTAGRRFETYDDDPSESASLRIRYDADLPISANRCMQKKEYVRVLDGYDDAEQTSSGLVQSSQGDVLDLGTIGATADHNSAVALRFPYVDVPNNAEITNAYIEVYSAQSDSGASSVRISALDHDDVSSIPGDDHALTDPLMRTSSALTVVVPRWHAPNQSYVIDSNLKPIVQEIVGRTGWRSGNAMAFVLEKISGADKYIKAAESGVQFAPRLTISYKTQFDETSFTAREEMQAIVEDTQSVYGGFEGTTPISDSLVEAIRYIRGEPVGYGAVRGHIDTTHRRITSVSHPSSYSGGSHVVPAGCNLQLDPYSLACEEELISGSANYVSPITETCQPTHIVFMTDGAATFRDDRTEEQLQAWTGSTRRCRNHEACSVGAASFVHDMDQSSLPGKQVASVHTISFDLSAEPEAIRLMQNIADAGGGSAYVADDYEQLLSAFRVVVEGIKRRSASITSAGVTLSQTNRLVHSDQVFLSMFEPSKTPRWAGNLKRYRLNNGELVDQSGEAALAPGSDQFSENAKSYWSGAVDGNDVKLGGAAEKLTVNRQVFTSLADSGLITSASNALSASNSAISSEMLNAENDLMRSKILRWLSGETVAVEGSGATASANKIFGDPLHSKPTVVSYKTAGETWSLVYVGTNNGFLHAINTETGIENWAFLPKELLSKQKDFLENAFGGVKGYGLDGGIRLFVQDRNRDGFVDSSAGDKAYLYVGMRRGGNNYFAIDVSDPSSPFLKFTIRPEGNFARLGQTWSTPVITQISTSEGPRTVMIFGGGYDVAQDRDLDLPHNDSVGNAIYIADAESGEFLWSSHMLALPMMTNSVPADVAVIDINGDGLSDRIYAVDTRAQIFRFDIEQTGEIDGGRLAHLQSNETEPSSNRRFYASPDVTWMRQRDGTQYVAVAVGSGFREKPLDEQINDHFYVVRDEGAFTGDIQRDISITDLLRINDYESDQDLDGVSDALSAIEEEGLAGWYYELESNGEKVVSEATIFNNMVFFSSYSPVANPDAQGCATVPGRARLYALSLQDGAPVVDADGDNLQDRYLEVDNCATCGFVPLQILATPDGFIGQLGASIIDPISDVLNKGEIIKKIKWIQSK